jgi:hypothetical protein
MYCYLRNDENIVNLRISIQKSSDSAMYGACYGPESLTGLCVSVSFESSDAKSVFRQTFTFDSTVQHIKMRGEIQASEKSCILLKTRRDNIITLPTQ